MPSGCAIMVLFSVLIKELKGRGGLQEKRSQMLFKGDGQESWSLSSAACLGIQVHSLPGCGDSGSHCVKMCLCPFLPV